MSRRVARETCFKLVFEYEFLKCKNDITLEELIGENNLEDEDTSFVSKTYEGIIAHNEEILNIISSNIKGYSLERLYKVDLAILKIAIYELKFDGTLPVSVIINEAVELCKKYSTDKSSGFVNGVLATIVGDSK